MIICRLPPQFPIRARISLGHFRTAAVRLCDALSFKQFKINKLSDMHSHTAGRRQYVPSRLETGNIPEILREHCCHEPFHGLILIHDGPIFCNTVRPRPNFPQGLKPGYLAAFRDD